VQVTRGARYADYFGINAGYAVTFTTTQPMKALVVNGYVKKGFEADATAGEIAYADASDDAVTSEQVLAVTNINATTVTINCVKQMRCYSVSIYFEENPEVDIEPGDDDDDDVYSFEWEPTTPTQMTITFDSLQMQDLTENLGYACTDLYFMSEEYEAEITVFASLDEFGLLPLGAYPIDTTYADNTVQASPGGDEYYDYPSYVITDFEQDPESGSWYYNTAYYLASGTLYVDMTESYPEQYLIRLEATTHFGSTIQTEYWMYLPVAGIEQTAAENTASKMLRNHELLIRKGGKTYTVMGVQVR